MKIILEILIVGFGLGLILTIQSIQRDFHRSRLIVSFGKRNKRS